MAMENKIFRFVGYWAMGLIMTMATAIVFRWSIAFLDWARFEAGDLATWVGALGAIAALFGTIYLATTETRRRHSDEMSLARLHCVGMRLRLIHVEIMLKQLGAKLSKATESNSTYEFAHATLNVFRKIDHWEVADLLPLIPLPDHTAAKLAQAVDEIRVIGRVLVQLEERYTQLTVADRMKLIRSIHPNMTKTSHLVAEASIQVNRAINELGIPVDR